MTAELSATAAREIVASLREVRMDFYEPDWKRALTGVSLDIRRGEVVALLGPEDSGLSTLLKILAGRLRPTSGKVRVFGRPPRRRAVRSRVSYLAGPEDEADSGGLRGFVRSILSGGKKAGRSGRTADATPRRIQLAQAVLGDGELVLLDEPFRGLDSSGMGELKTRIRALAQRDRTVILSSHWIADAAGICDRMAVFSNGSCEAIGNLEQLLASPKAARLLCPLAGPETLERLVNALREDLARAGQSDSAGEPLEAAGGGQTAARPQPSPNAGDIARDPLTKPEAAADAAVSEGPGDAVDHKRLAELTKSPKEE